MSDNDDHITDQHVVDCDAGDRFIVGRYFEPDSAPFRVVLYQDDERVGEAYMRRAEVTDLIAALKETLA